MPDLLNVEIFGVGTWNNMKFVLEDLDQIVGNTNGLMSKGTHKPPIKLGHSTNQILSGQEDGDPALGRAVNIRVAGDKIIADFENLPDILFTAIGKSRFTSVSVEMDHIKNFGWFLTAVSLLGADLPAVKSLEDLQAFLIDEQDSSEVNTHQLVFSEPNFLKTSEDIGGKMPDEQATFADTTATEAIVDENKELKVQLADMKAKETDSSTKFSDTDAELKRYKAKETERSFSDKKEEILKVYREDSKAGKLAPAIVDKIEKFLDEQKTTFSDGDNLSISPELAREVGKGYAEKLDTKEQTSDGDRDENEETPDILLDREIAKVQAANAGLSWEEADALVWQTHPKLYSDYQDWSKDIALGRF